ncbi:MAG: ABC transporter substrate-binding protein [Bacillota bacterium]
MKKLLLLALLFIFSFSLVACDDGDITDEDNDVIDDNDDNDDNDNNDDNDDDNNDDDTTKNIVLTYADWGDSDLNQAMLDAFMEEYPNITVELRKDITGAGGEFTANLLNAQAANVLPDVFAIDNVPTGFSNGMLYDVTDLWDADPDTAAVYPNIKDTAVYNGARYAIPSFQFVKGIYLNLSLFDEYNITVPDKDWTYDEFVDLAIEIRQAGQSDFVYAIDPWYGDLDFESMWPTQDFEDVGYNTWDGTQFNFTSDAWIDAYEDKLDLWAQDVVADPPTYTEEEQAEYGSEWPWLQGYTAMSIDGSWNMWMVDTMYEEYGFEVGFWPYPGGDAGQFPPTILDYIVVSSQTEHPEEAYLLAKWMSFGEEGWNARLDIMEEEGQLYLDRFPVADYPDVWDRANDFLIYVEGVEENVALFEYSKPDVDKWLPGYKAFWEWVQNDDNDYFTRIGEGLITPNEFASEWETKLNELVQEALESYE